MPAVLCPCTLACRPAHADQGWRLRSKDPGRCPLPLLNAEDCGACRTETPAAWAGLPCSAGCWLTKVLISACCLCRPA